MTRLVNKIYGRSQRLKKKLIMSGEPNTTARTRTGKDAWRCCTLVRTTFGVFPREKSTYLIVFPNLESV